MEKMVVMSIEEYDAIMVELKEYRKKESDRLSELNDNFYSNLDKWLQENNRGITTEVYSNGGIFKTARKYYCVFKPEEWESSSIKKKKPIFRI